MRLARDRAEVTACATGIGLGMTDRALAIPLGLVDRAVINAVARTSTVIGRGTAQQDEPGENHPAVKALRAGLEFFGAPQVGVQLHLNGAIPRGKGLGSHSASTLMGVLAAHQLVNETPKDESVVQICATLGANELRVRTILREAALLQVPGSPDLTELTLPPLIQPVAFVPDFSAVEPKSEPPQLNASDADAEAARAALLALLLSGTEVSGSEEQFAKLLTAATVDPRGVATLEQAAPSTASLIGWLRENGVAAVRTGAGSAALSLLSVPTQVARAAERSGWKVLDAAESQLRGAAGEEL